MSYAVIAYDVADGVATITLDRPAKLNAFTVGMMDELLDVLDRVDADDAVRAVIVTGAGRAFCAGADLSEGARTFERMGGDFSMADHADEGGRVTLRLSRCLKPLIAAVNGPAVGVGATMTLPMDVRLASHDARFGFVFTRRGLVPEACSSWFLPRVVGIQQAAEWVLTGRVFDAQEALDGRLVRSSHAPADLLPAARELAAEIAENTSAVSVALSRTMLWRMLEEPGPESAHAIDSRGIHAMGAGADAREGVTSFLERRPPAFPQRVSTDLPPFFDAWRKAGGVAAFLKDLEDRPGPDAGGVDGAPGRA
jgi:enoyl-CoA hydratase/carnithine racemase